MVIGRATEGTAPVVSRRTPYPRIRNHTPSWHHKICAPTGPNLGKSYSITNQEKGARATQPLEQTIVQWIIVIRIGGTDGLYYIVKHALAGFLSAPATSTFVSAALCVALTGVLSLCSYWYITVNLSIHPSTHPSVYLSIDRNGCLACGGIQSLSYAWIQIWIKRPCRFGELAGSPQKMPAQWHVWSWSPWWRIPSNLPRW